MITVDVRIRMIEEFHLICTRNKYVFNQRYQLQKRMWKNPQKAAVRIAIEMTIEKQAIRGQRSRFDKAARIVPCPLLLPFLLHKEQSIWWLNSHLSPTGVKITQMIGERASSVAFIIRMWISRALGTTVSAPVCEYSRFRVNRRRKFLLACEIYCLI